MAAPISSILRDPIAVEDAATRSRSIKEALGLLGLRAAGGNYRAFHEACTRIGIVPPQTVRTPPPGFTPHPDALVFCEHSTYTNRGGIKKRLIASGMPECCANCGLGPKWNGAPLTLQLDHINGVHDDNRRENLRLLCPNCHSQTESFTGRTGERTPCPYCAHGNRATSKRCGRCKRWLIQLQGSDRIDWPPREALLRLVADQSKSAVARSLGVSEAAVRKRLRKLAA